MWFHVCCSRRAVGISLMFQCSEIDEVTNACLNWVNTSLFGLPDLTAQQAGELATAVIGLWAIAVGGAFVVRSFFNNSHR